MKNKENYFGCLTFIACVILGIGWVASSSKKNEEIKLLNTKIGIKDEIIQNLENKAEKESETEAEAKNNQKLKLPAYVYLDRENCIHMFSTCYNISPMESRHIKNNYDEVNINISNETTSSHNYAIKRLKIGETDFSKYEWYCSECVLDDFYDLLQTKNVIDFVPEEEDFSKYKRNKPTAAQESATKPTTPTKDFSQYKETKTKDWSQYEVTETKDWSQYKRKE